MDYDPEKKYFVYTGPTVHDKSEQQEEKIYFKWENKIINENKINPNCLAVPDVNVDGEYSFYINGYEISTKQKEVNLSLTYPDIAKYMCITNIENNCPEVKREESRTTKEWELTDGEGEKIVYAYFYDENGNHTKSLSDTIKLYENISPPIIIASDGIESDKWHLSTFKLKTENYSSDYN